MEQEYTIDNSYLSPEAQKRKKDLEENPASRTNHMEYMDGMEVLDSDIKDKVRAAMQSYDYNAYTDADVRTALANAKQGHCGIEDFKALLSPAALPHLEEMAALAQKERLSPNWLRRSLMCSACRAKYLSLSNPIFMCSTSSLRITFSK